MVAVTLYLAIATLALVIAYFKVIYRKRSENEPPIPAGHWLWGNGEEFSKQAVKFLHKTQKSLGDIFTIRLLNTHLTVVMDPHSYENFVRESNFDFDPIQKQVNHNVFSFGLVDSKKMLKEASKRVKGQYLSKGLRQFSTYLNETYETVSSTNDLPQTEWRTECLRQFNSKTLFVSMFYTIFGKGKGVDSFEPLKIYQNFDLYHKYFNYLWLGLPVCLFPKAMKALEVLIQQPGSAELLSRGDLSEYIRFSTQFMLDHGQTETDIIGHNLVYLHVNYNTFRMVFWEIYYLMVHPEALAALREEITSVVNSKVEDGEIDEETGKVIFDQNDVEKLQMLDSITNETLRLSSGVFMIRSISQDTDFTMHNGNKYSLRKGDKVAMYPPTIHKDPEIFENPEEYKHDRFVDAKFYKYGKELRNPVLSFGSLCPGKKYAILQAKWFVLSLVYMYDFELLDGESTELDVNYYGHEVLPPVNDVNMRYRLRDNVQQVEFGSLS